MKLNSEIMFIANKTKCSSVSTKDLGSQMQLHTWTASILPTAISNWSTLLLKAYTVVGISGNWVWPEPLQVVKHIRERVGSNSGLIKEVLLNPSAAFLR